MVSFDNVQKIITNCFGSRNQRVIAKITPLIQQTRILQKKYNQYSDIELKQITNNLKQKLIANDNNLNSILPEAFAAVIVASQRTLNLVHYDEQILGGIILHQGKIAEMATGEGKTLAATLPAYLHALTGKGVHIVTVNPYLASRDCEWMQPIYQALDISTAVILPNMELKQKQQAYQADIVYGTNNEFGFDYLRDNMAQNTNQVVQRSPYYAIVDEVDSVLIDEARTPLIISGEADMDEINYPALLKIGKLLQQGCSDNPQDFHVDEQEKNIIISETGHNKLENYLIENNILINSDLYEPKNIGLLHNIHCILKALYIFQKDVHYICSNNQIVIIDEHTGRAMPGRRWSDGIHQALEAKENLPIQKESRTLASITFQNYFRMYHTLAGMTGTANTEAFEFQQIYNLEVIAIPTHKPVIRHDFTDKMYLDKASKFTAIVNEITNKNATGQPILVGTASIEVSEHISALLKAKKIPHQLLNAKQNDKEAEIISQAGCKGLVTIATNMAGRGTDIQLGGSLKQLLKNSTDKNTTIKQWQTANEEVKALGGLHIIGTERHESRRIDNQLIGRAGRQGDPGSSQFYLSLDDDLMRIFASPKVKGLMQKLGLRDNETLEHPILNKQIESAQRKVEGFNFDIRKQLLQFDNVANEQRNLIYTQRQMLLSSKDISTNINSILQLIANNLTDQYLPIDSLAQDWNTTELEAILRNNFMILCPINSWIDNNPQITQTEIKNKIFTKLSTKHQTQEELFSKEVMRELESSIMLNTVDQYWHEHLAKMDQLREGIHLRGYAQKNPVEEYKKDSFEMFQQMLFEIKQETITILLQATPKPVEIADINRNAPCPCNSGKKYKHCHGKV